MEDALTRLRASEKWLFAFAAMGYIALACLTAARRPLWYDELVAYHLACLPDLRTFWSALIDGTDLNPPLHHLSLRAVTALRVDGPTALRLPSIVGFGVMALCLYRIASHRFGRAAAWVAVLLPFTTRAYWYAFEARPYGLLLGFGAAAFLCWQAATEGRKRPLALAALALSLAGAISTHFYAVFVFLCLALGELARARSRRRWDLPIWAAFLLGAAPLALYWPVIRSARARSGDFWSQPSWTKWLDFYSWLISAEAIFPLIVLGVVAFYFARVAHPAARAPSEDGHRLSSAPIHECVAIAAFTLIPIGVEILAKTVTNAFTERYALPTIIGISLMAASLLDWRRWGRMAALIPALVFLCWVPFVQVLACRRVATERDAPSLLRRELEHEELADLPILVADARDYLQLQRLVPEPLASQLVFPSDAASSRIEASSSSELKTLSHWVDLKLDDLASLRGAYSQFLVFGSAESGLVSRLQEPDSGTVVIARGPELFLVQRIRLGHRHDPGESERVPHPSPSTTAARSTQPDPHSSIQTARTSLERGSTPESPAAYNHYAAAVIRSR